MDTFIHVLKIGIFQYWYLEKHEDSQYPERYVFMGNTHWKTLCVKSFINNGDLTQIVKTLSVLILKKLMYFDSYQYIFFQKGTVKKILNKCGRVSCDVHVVEVNIWVCTTCSYVTSFKPCYSLTGCTLIYSRILICSK